MNLNKVSTSDHGKVSKKRDRSNSSDDSSSDDNKKVFEHKKRKDKPVLKQKKRRNTTKDKYKKGKSRPSSSDSSTSEDSSTSSSSDDSSSTSEEEKLRKRRRKSKKQKQLEKNKNEEKAEDGPSNDIPLEFMDQRKTMAPMTKEEWEKKQSVVKRVYDETTGRNRLIKGDGEVIEEIVSRDRHKQINQQATKGDGDYFQSQLKKM